MSKNYNYLFCFIDSTKPASHTSATHKTNSHPLAASLPLSGSVRYASSYSFHDLVKNLAIICVIKQHEILLPEMVFVYIYICFYSHRECQRKTNSYENLQNLVRDTVEISRAAISSGPTNSHVAASCDASPKRESQASSHK